MEHPLEEKVASVDNLALARPYAYCHHSAVQIWFHLWIWPIATAAKAIRYALAPNVNGQLGGIRVRVRVS